jgi:hypothetical protein
MSQFDKWKESFDRDPEAFREQQKSEKIFIFDKAVIRLQKLQNHMSGYDLEDWFGEQLGKHLWEKFAIEHNRNVLSWFNKLTNEYRFFITTKLNTDSRYS